MKIRNLKMVVEDGIEPSTRGFPDSLDGHSDEPGKTE